MDLGLVGLGKMGGNMRTRLRNAGHTVVGYDRNPDVTDVGSLAELVEQLPQPQGRLGDGARRRPDPRDGQGARRPARRGRPRRRRRQLPWTDDQANAELLAEKGIGFVDCGVSGGVWGLENGYALMCGGDPTRTSRRCSRPSTRSSPRASSASCTPASVGAGHFSKMVHNGIEYAIMQAYAEGWELLEKVDLVDNVTEVFRLLARGHRDPVLAARPAGRRARRGRPTSTRSRLRRGLRRGPVDRRGRRSTTPCRCPPSPRRCSPASSPGRTTARR